MSWLRVVLISSFIGMLSGLYCPDFKHMRRQVEMADLQEMSSEEILSCLDYFGREPLALKEASFIWKTLVKDRGGVEDVSDLDLRQLGWILPGVPEEDLRNFTLNEVDTITALGQYYNLSVAQLEVLAERVLEDWSGKDPTDYTNYDLTALQHILCGFNRSIIESIHPDAYKAAAETLATLKGCPQETLEALASLAISGDAFGPPSQWTSSQVKNIGCILNGLPPSALETIPPIGIESVTPEIIPCMNVATIKAMTSTQLSHLTPSAVAALTPEQQATFSKDKQRAVVDAYEALESRKGSAASEHYGPKCTFEFILLGLTFMF